MLRTVVGTVALGLVTGSALLFSFDLQTYAQNPGNAGPSEESAPNRGKPAKHVVKPIPAGFGVHWTGTVVKLQNLKNKALTAHHDTTSHSKSKLPLRRRTKHKGAPNPGPAVLNPNYVTYTSWLDETDFIKSFRTTWTVPLPPTNHNNQIVYIWNGIEPADGNHVLQPVLQWGASPAGGGASWNIASWYVASTGQVSVTPLVAVNPGQVLTGVITYTASEVDAASGGTVYSYTCGFDGFPQTQLNVSGVPKLTWAMEVLECYNSASGVLTNPLEFPNTDSSHMSGISIKRTTTLSGTQIPWERYAPGSSNGQGIGFDKWGSGQVVIYYKKQY